MFLTLDINCPFVPDILDLNDFGEWVATDPGDYGDYPFHNRLKLFLWLLNYFGIDYDRMNLDDI